MAAPRTHRRGPGFAAVGKTPEQLELFLSSCPALPVAGRDPALETTARVLLGSLGLNRLAAAVRVEWNGRMRSAAGRADGSRALISLNPRLRQHGPDEIDRTLRHELAHLVAQARAGRRRVAPHGCEWRIACCDLGLAGEARCHQLPFPVRPRRRRFLYRCPACALEFPRFRRLRHTVACLACCRKFNGGRFDARFRLRLVRSH